MRSAKNMQALQSLQNTADQDIHLAHTALNLGVLLTPAYRLERYYNHLDTLVEDVASRHRNLIEAGADDNAGTKLAALKYGLADQHGYRGDKANYDDLQNANMIRVIDRRKGMPIALCILYIHVARAQGWTLHGLNFPGHFLLRLEDGPARVIFDPFNDCHILDASHLRRMIKSVNGDDAELSSTYYDACGNRQILIRLLNNVKYRQIDMDDYMGAVRTVEAMRLIDEKDYRSLFDAGILYSRIGQPLAAIKALEEYLLRNPSKKDQHDAAQLLQHIRTSMQ